MTARRAPSGLENALLARSKGEDAQSARHQIVVIDDDLASRGSLAFIFKSQYEVITCATAREGVAAVNEETCAVILDIRMPEQDGFSACDEIRRLHPDMPIIFYSAYQNAKDPLEIINDHRPFAYVVKGGDLDKLVRLVGLAVQLQAVIVKNRRLLTKLQAEREATR